MCTGTYKEIFWLFQDRLMQIMMVQVSVITSNANIGETIYDNDELNIKDYNIQKKRSAKFFLEYVIAFYI